MYMEMWILFFSHQSLALFVMHILTHPLPSLVNKQKKSFCIEHYLLKKNSKSIFSQRSCVRFCKNLEIQLKSDDLDILGCVQNLDSKKFHSKIFSRCCDQKFPCFEQKKNNACPKFFLCEIRFSNSVSSQFAEI